jgi:hypothetical protein
MSLLICTFVTVLKHSTSAIGPQHGWLPSCFPLSFLLTRLSFHMLQFIYGKDEIDAAFIERQRIKVFHLSNRLQHSYQAAFLPPPSLNSPAYVGPLNTTSPRARPSPPTPIAIVVLSGLLVSLILVSKFMQDKVRSQVVSLLCRPFMLKALLSATRIDPSATAALMDNEM